MLADFLLVPALGESGDLRFCLPANPATSVLGGLGDVEAAQTVQGQIETCAQQIPPSADAFLAQIARIEAGRVDRQQRPVDIEERCCRFS